jgi:hypothetical protein
MIKGTYSTSVPVINCSNLYLTSNSMTPIHFFQLSKTYQYSVLQTRGIFIREKIKDPYRMQLFLFENYYYELCSDKRTNEIFYISFMEEYHVDQLYPGKCEKEISRDSNKQSDIA